MKKEKFHIEYIFDKVSRRSLWNHLTTALVRLERGSGNPRFDVLFNVLKTLGLSIHIQ